MIRNCIFDFNGTMFLDDEKHVISWRKYAMEKFGVEIPDEDFSKHIHGFNNKAILEYLSKKTLTEEEVEKMSTEKELMYQKLCQEDSTSLHLTPGLESFLDDLKEKGYTLAIATASRRPNVEWYIKTFSLLRWFKKENIIYDDGTLTKGKPDPMIYLRALDRIQGKAIETVVFEDAESGIKSAYGAQVNQIIALKKSKEPSQEIKNMVTCFISDFTNLSNNFLNLKK